MTLLPRLHKQTDMHCADSHQAAVFTQTIHVSPGLNATVCRCSSYVRLPTRQHRQQAQHPPSTLPSLKSRCEILNLFQRSLRYSSAQLNLASHSGWAQLGCTPRVTSKR